MSTQLSPSPAPGLAARILQSYVAGISRGLASGEQLIYPGPSMPDAHSPRDGRHDFDFYHGRWQVRNERLKERLVGCSEWEHFPATQYCQPILDGVGNIDDFITEWGSGFRGMTLRLFDLNTRQWSIYWASNRTGVLEAPVVGCFKDGVGRFYGRDQHNGQPVLVRFLWHEITADRAHWEQAFSIDDGQHWETNWHMRMTRLPR